MTLSENILQRIEQKKAIIGVIGLDYVGLPLILCFAEKGFKSIGFDIDKNKTTSLMQGKSYIRHIPAERIKKVVDSVFFLLRKALRMRLNATLSL